MFCSILTDWMKTKDNSKDEVPLDLIGLKTNKEGNLMDDLRDSRIMKERGVLGDLRGIKINRKEDALSDLRVSREGGKSSLTSINNNGRWRLVEFEDGYFVVTNFCGECLEANTNGEVNYSDCILDNDYQLWRKNGEILMNKATKKCLNVEDETNFRIVECD